MKEYLEYLAQPYKKLGVIELSAASTFLFSALNWVLTIFIPEWIGISAPLFFLYLGMALLDTSMGILNNVIVKKQKFDKEIFFKKVFMVGLAFIALGMTSHLEKYTKLDYIKPLFEVCRLFFYVSFIIYEFTSIREKSEQLKYNNLVALIDIILLPLTLIKDMLKSRFKNENNQNENNQEN